MTPKIEKLARDIDKTQAKITELKARIHDMELQKTELENTEIVALFRSLDVPSERLPAFIASVKTTPSLPETQSAPARQDSPAPYASTFLRDSEEADHEN